MPRRSAVSIATFGPSTCTVMTSMPWSARLFAASASFTGNDAVEILSEPDIAKVGAGVGRMLALRPQPATVTELDLRVFFRDAEHVRIEIAETRWKQQRRAIELDHALHGLLNVEGFSDLFFLQHLDAGH